jgi:hypothetical protein
MKANLILTVLGLVLTAGCATTQSKPHCTIATTHSATELDICMGSDEVKAGDHIGFFKTKCTVPSRGSPQTCRPEKIGEGVVVKTLDEHLSSVKMSSEFRIEEGMTLEKIR